MGFHKRYIDDEQIIEMYRRDGNQAVIDWLSKGVDSIITSGELSADILDILDLTLMTKTEKWNKISYVRQVCNAAIEERRSSKELGSSLEVDLEIYLSDEYLKLVKNIDLSEFCITSGARAKLLNTEAGNLFHIESIEGIKVLVSKAEGNKCPRCWKIVKGICERCEEATSA